MVVKMTEGGHPPPPRPFVCCKTCVIMCLWCLISTSSILFLSMFCCLVTQPGTGPDFFWALIKTCWEHGGIHLLHYRVQAVPLPVLSNWQPLCCRTTDTTWGWCKWNCTAELVKKLKVELRRAGVGLGEKEGACGVCTHCSDSILRLCLFPWICVFCHLYVNQIDF